MSLPSFTRQQSASQRGQLGERGATLLEMSMVLPLFFLLVFGIMEFSYAFAQNNEVRHVAYEAAREASVSPGAGGAALVCDKFALVDSGATYAFTSGSGGGTASLTVSVPYSTLTGLFDTAFAGATLESTHKFYVEQPVGGGGTAWSGSGGAC